MALSHKAPTASRLLPAFLCLPLVCGCGGVDKNDMLARATARAIHNRSQPPEEEPQEPPPAAKLEEPTARAAAASQTPPVQAVTEPGAPTAKSPSAPAAGAGQQQPSSLDPQEQATRSAANLERIAQAVLLYAKTEGNFPPRGLNKLSWRVYVLPQLGYEELFKQFRLNEPWDSPYNSALIDQMPDIYRMPGHTGFDTHYFAVGGPATLFWHPARTEAPRRLGENESSTLMLVETDSESAVPWTEPIDFSRDPDNPADGLGGMRNGDALVAWADGQVTRLNLSAPRKQLQLAFRLYEEDELKPLKRSSVSGPVDAPVAAATVKRSGPEGAARADNTVAGTGRPSSPRVAAAPASELALQYLAAAETSYAQGNRVEAWQWLSGAIAAGLPPQQWHDDFHWVPGLRRPALGLHLGVAALTIVPGDRGRGSNRGPGLQAERRSQLLDLAAPIGEPFLNLLEEHAGLLTPNAFDVQPLSKSRGKRAQARLSYLKPSSSMGALRREARQAGCDVLAVFALDNSASGRSLTLDLVLYDIRRGGSQELLDVRKVTANTEEDTLDQPTRERLRAAKWQLKDYLEDELTPGEWPLKLTNAIVARRLSSIGGAKTDHPLPVLAEMLHYRDLGLADNVQLLAAMNQLLGREQGPSLVLGADRKKRRVLRQWLPSDDPASVVELAQRNRRNADDDDD